MRRDQGAWAKPKGLSMPAITEERRGICGVCSAGCWIVASYDGSGRIVGVRPDEGSPMGMICRLGEHSPDIIYSEHRLLHPMRRKGDKGSYEFERISWDDAYGIIVDRLNRIKQEYGPEAAAIYTGVGSFDSPCATCTSPRASQSRRRAACFFLTGRRTPWAWAPSATYPTA